MSKSQLVHKMWITLWTTCGYNVENDIFLQNFIICSQKPYKIIPILSI